MRIELPFSITLPAGGSWPTTVSTGLLDATANAFGLRPALTSVLIASSRVLPITLGTVTVSLPFETVMSTLPCFWIFSPASGLWSITVPFVTVSLVSREICGTSPAALIFSTASGSFRPFTNGTATGLFAFSWSWIFVYANQAATPAAASSRIESTHGQTGRRRRGGPS
jgi:hypothetical protein